MGCEHSAIKGDEDEDDFWANADLSEIFDSDIESKVSSTASINQDQVQKLDKPIDQNYPSDLREKLLLLEQEVQQLRQRLHKPATQDNAALYDAPGPQSQNVITDSQRALSHVDSLSRKTDQTVTKEEKKQQTTTHSLSQVIGARLNHEVVDNNKTKAPSTQSTKSAKNDGLDGKDGFTGLYIKNRLIGSFRIQELMKGKRFVPVNQIISAAQSTTDKKSEMVVTFGVIARKTSTKQSKTGANFSIWTLSDLNQGNVPLFVSGDVHAKHWREENGTFIGVCSPTVMDQRGSSTSAMLTVRNPAQLLIVGICSDYGICRALKRDGSSCSVPVNLQLGEYCSSHVTAAYRKKTRSGRQVLNQGLGPMPTAERMLAARSIKQRKGSNFVGTQNQVSTLYADKTSSKRSKTMMDNIKQQIRLETVTSLSSNNTFRKVMRTMTASNPLARKMVEHEHKEAAKRRDGSFLQPSSVRPDYKAHPGMVTDTCDKLFALSGDRTPTLARGARPGSLITLNSSSSNLAKAIAVVKNMGGLQKQNPNSVQRTLVIINYDLLQEPDREKIHNSLKTRAAEREEADKGHKKSSVLAHIVGGINDEEKNCLLRTKSKHLAEYEAAEAVELENAFGRAEELEKLEAKMRTITEKVVLCFRCVECKRLSLKKPDYCLKEGHQVKKVKAKKRFFECSKCNKHIFTIGQRLPSNSCMVCGALAWRAATSFKEQKQQTPSMKTHFGE
eukprot:gene9567-1794_t